MSNSIFSITGKCEKHSKEESVWHTINTPGEYGRSIPVYFPPRVQSPPLGKFLCVTGRVSLNKSSHLLLIADRWTETQSGIESKFIKKQETDSGKNGDSDDTF